MQDMVLASFMHAAEEVMAEIGFEGIRIQAETLPNAGESDVLVMIGLAGDLKGHFVLSFNRDPADRFIQALHQHLGLGQHDREDQAYRKSALSEVANQMSGRAMVHLADQQIDAMITPPTVISGSSIAACLPESNDRFMYHIQGLFGDFLCTVALKNSKVV